MVVKVLKSSALYGRIETELEVPAFKLMETQQMLPRTCSSSSYRKGA
jgi:hypothetical protein